jgi:5'(3')-deoxyribonucleotidase
MNRTPVVGMDLDDVVADFIESFMNIAGRLYGVDVNLRPTSWEWDEVNMTKDMVDGTWKEIIATVDFWQRLKVIPGVDRGLIRHLDSRVKLYFPTARAVTAGKDVGKQSAYWLQDNLNIDYPTVIVSSEKAEMARALKYDYFIDDRPKNCIEVKEALPNCNVFLCDATHNRTFHDTRFPRLANVNEFAHIVLTGSTVN